MSLPEALSPADVERLDAAITELKEAGRGFAGSHDSREVQFFMACLNLAEVQASLLKAMPGALAAVHQSIEIERIRLKESLKFGHETVTALHKIDENAVRKQVLNLTSQVLSSLRPEIDNRARLLNERMTMKQVGGLIVFTSAVAIVIFLIGRFSV